MTTHLTVVERFRIRLINKLPDSFNFCTKYTGKPALFRGINNPLWIIYKWLCSPQSRCVYRVYNGVKIEELCICCEQVWLAMVVGASTFLYGLLVAVQWVYCNPWLAFGLMMVEPLAVIMGAAALISFFTKK